MEGMLTVLTMTKAQRMGYWVLLLLFAAGIAIGGLMCLTESPRMVAEFTRLGYPVYFMKILGTGELAGLVALIFTRSPEVKEWCYAGFAVTLIGTALSHVALEDPVQKVIVPLLFLTVLGACYKLEHPKHHLTPPR